MKRKSITKILLFSVLSVGLVSCEQEFTQMGSEIIDGDQFGFDKYTVQNVSAANDAIGVSNTRNLPINSLGVYSEKAFGSTAAHIVTQIEMTGETDLSDIGNNPVLDSVYVYIPFTSSVKSTEASGDKIYTVSNLYGSGKFGLNVYENGYYLREADPSGEFDTQYYYADDKKTFDQNKKGISGTGRLNNSAKTFQNTEFQFDKAEIKLYAYNADGTPQKDDDDKPKVKERLAPGIWLDLDKAYFQNRFFANNQYKSIANNNQLKTFFRGLYFESVNSFNQNALVQLALQKGKLVFVYKYDGDTDPSTNKPKRERKTLEFRLGYDSSESSASKAVTVNLFESNFVLSNNSAGNIWLKGGGYPTYGAISLFGADANGNGKADELETIIANKWLINQAVLTMYVDHAATGLDTIVAPKQLYLYDFKNNKVLADYTSDNVSSTGKPIFGGGLNTKNKSLHKYQFRLTNHIANLIQKDSTNVPLGLVVASDIMNSSMNPVKPVSKKIPVTATMNPFGTIVYGPEASNGDLRMKLEIYYTKEK